MTATSRAWWSLPSDSARLIELDPSQCRELLFSVHIGRLAYVTDRGPRIVPMNYVVAGDNLVFRTAVGNEAARHSRGRPVAFEVDRADEVQHAGWSVLVVGVAEELTVAMLASLDIGRTPDPWAEGTRSLFLHLPLTDITGRLVPAA